MKSILTFIFLSYVVLVGAQSVEAEVFAVHDGDSFKVLVKGETKKKWVRIWGVDSPELVSNYITAPQPYGKQAGDSLRTLIKHKIVTIETVAKDVYGREVVMANLGEIDLTQYIIEKGWGWCSIDPLMPPRYADKLIQLQNQAKDSKLGLWGFPGPKLAPRDWRLTHRRF